MIQIGDNVPNWQADLKREIETMASLLDDMQRLAAGAFPSHGELSVAPALVNAQLSVGPEVCLAGLSIGHPILGSKPVRTSACVVYAPAQGWARTWSRLYRLEHYE